MAPSTPRKGVFRLLGGLLSMGLLGLPLVLLLATPGLGAQGYRCTDFNGLQYEAEAITVGHNCEALSASIGSVAGPPRGEEGSRRRYLRFASLIEEASREYLLPHAYLRAVIRVESNFIPTIVSPDGAAGLMQLMPEAARTMGVTDPFDPRQNVLGGARYLRIIANRFQGDLRLTTAAYNAGEGAVLEHGGVPPFAETQRYVHRVMHYYRTYRAQAPLRVRP